MNRSLKIASAAGVAGLMLATIVGMAWRGPSTTPATTAGVQRPSEAPPHIDLSRCRTVTTQDLDCTKAWDAERRRFFRDDAR